MTTNVFFVINLATANAAEMAKIDEMAAFLKAHPQAKVTVTGYADAGTGTKSYNLALSKKRAEYVASKLQAAGVAASQITVDAKGDTVQPFAENDKNRVAICVAE